MSDRGLEGAGRNGEAEDIMDGRSAAESRSMHDDDGDDAMAAPVLLRDQEQPCHHERGGGGGRKEDDLVVMAAVLERGTATTTMDDNDEEEAAAGAAAAAAGAPVELRCPISLELMADPVIVASGQTYERACIRAWLANGNTSCPTTGQQLPHLSLIPNYTVKAMIGAWCQRQGLAPPRPPKISSSGPSSPDKGAGGESSGGRSSSSTSSSRSSRRAGEVVEQAVRTASAVPTSSSSWPPERAMLTRMMMVRSSSDGNDARGRRSVPEGLPLAMPQAKRVAPIRRTRSLPGSPASHTVAAAAAAAASAPASGMPMTTMMMMMEVPGGGGPHSSSMSGGGGAVSASLFLPQCKNFPVQGGRRSHSCSRSSGSSTCSSSSSSSSSSGSGHSSSSEYHHHHHHHHHIGGSSSYATQQKSSQSLNDSDGDKSIVHFGKTAEAVLSLRAHDGVATMESSGGEEEEEAARGPSSFEESSEEEAVQPQQQQQQPQHEAAAADDSEDGCTECGHSLSDVKRPSASSSSSSSLSTSPTVLATTTRTDSDVSQAAKEDDPDIMSMRDDTSGLPSAPAKETEMVTNSSSSSSTAGERRQTTRSDGGDDEVLDEMQQQQQRGGGLALVPTAMCRNLVGMRALHVDAAVASSSSSSCVHDHDHNIHSAAAKMGCADMVTMMGNSVEAFKHCKDILELLKRQLKETLPERVGVVERAAGEVRRLSKEVVELRTVMGQEGIIDALVPLLQCKHQPTVEHATAALVNLSIHTNNKPLIMRAGAVPYLMELLTYGFAEAQEHSAAVLLSLSLLEDTRPALGAIGAIPPLLRVVCTGNARARRDAAVALYSLSLFSLNRAKMLKAGGVPILLALASDPGALPLRPHAFRILAALATSGEGRAALSCGMNAEMVVRMLREYRSTDSHGGAAAGAAEDAAEIGSGGSKDVMAVIDCTVAILYALAHPPSVNFSHRLRALLSDPLVLSNLHNICNEPARGARVKEKATWLLKYVGDRDAGGSVFRRYASDPAVVGGHGGEESAASSSRRSAEQLEDLTLHARSLTDSQFFSMMDNFLDRNIVQATPKRGRSAHKNH